MLLIALQHEYPNQLTIGDKLHIKTQGTVTVTLSKQMVDSILNFIIFIKFVDFFFSFFNFINGS